MSERRRTSVSVEGEKGLFQDSITGTYSKSFRINGRQVKISSNKPSVKAAKAEINKKHRDRTGESKKHFIPLLSYWMGKYIEHREIDEEAGKSATRNSVNAIKQALPFFKDMHPKEFNRDKWIEFYHWYKSEYQNQFDNTHKYVRNFFRWLAEEDYLGNPVIDRVPTLKNFEAKKNRLARKQKKERVFTEKEFQKIYSVADKRERVLITLMYLLAMRVESDALSSRWAQYFLDLDLPYYYFGEGDNKAGLEGRTPIHNVALEHLREWKKETGHSKWVFPQEKDDSKHLVNQAIDWKGLRGRAKIGWHWTPHTFRHTCFTRLAERNVPMHYIVKCYRISAKEFMETYAHLTPEGMAEYRNVLPLKVG